MYVRMAKEAKAEGFADIAKLFEQVGKIEKEHEARYRALLENVKTNKVFKKAQSVPWQCANCGYNHKGGSAPKLCPVCKHPQAYFEVVALTY
jgi:rubrerythrin